MWQLEEILQDYILCHSLAIWGKKWVPLGFVSLLSCVNIHCVLNVSSSQLECRKLNPHCNTVGNGALGEVFRTPGFCPSEWMELLQKSLIEAVSLCPFWLLTWIPHPGTLALDSQVQTYEKCLFFVDYSTSSTCHGTKWMNTTSHGVVLQKHYMEEVCI